MFLKIFRRNNGELLNRSQPFTLLSFLKFQTSLFHSNTLAGNISPGGPKGTSKPDGIHCIVPPASSGALQSLLPVQHAQKTLNMYILKASHPDVQTT